MPFGLLFRPPAAASFNQASLAAWDFSRAGVFPHVAGMSPLWSGGSRDNLSLRHGSGHRPLCFRKFSAAVCAAISGGQAAFGRDIRRYPNVALLAAPTSTLSNALESGFVAAARSPTPFFASL